MEYSRAFPYESVAVLGVRHHESANASRGELRMFERLFFDRTEGSSALVSLKAAQDTLSWLDPWDNFNWVELQHPAEAPLNRCLFATSLFSTPTRWWILCASDAQPSTIRKLDRIGAVSSARRLVWQDDQKGATSVKTQSIQAR